MPVWAENAWSIPYIQQEISLLFGILTDMLKTFQILFENYTNYTKIMVLTWTQHDWHTTIYVIYASMVYAFFVFDLVKNLKQEQSKLYATSAYIY